MKNVCPTLISIELIGLEEEKEYIITLKDSILAHFYVDQEILNELINDANYREYMEFTLNHFHYDESNPYHYIIRQYYCGDNMSSFHNASF